MSDADGHKEHNEDVETALLDADLFAKYKAPEKAIKRLRSAIEHYPRSVKLRERLREIAVYKHPEEAARQCLALANLYIAREDFEAAYERLLEAKQLDPRISITPGLKRSGALAAQTFTRATGRTRNQAAKIRPRVQPRSPEICQR